MKIGVPVEHGKLCSHFGNCDAFSIFDVQDKEILRRVDETALPGEFRLLPHWLVEKGVGVVIAGGMEKIAQTIFTEKNIQVVISGASDSPETVVEQYLNGSIPPGAHDERPSRGG